MKTFYVSMTRDLLGVYIAYQAESRKAVNQYLEREYLSHGQWKLPWCAVYEVIPDVPHVRGPIILEAICGTLEEEIEFHAEVSNG